MKSIEKIQQFFAAIKVMVKALIAPIVQLTKQVNSREPVKPSLLAFAGWRVLVWLTFTLCITGSLGIPPLVAYLFMVDLVIVGVQTVQLAAA